MLRKWAIEELPLHKDITNELDVDAAGFVDEAVAVGPVGHHVIYQLDWTIPLLYRDRKSTINLISINWLLI